MKNILGKAAPNFVEAAVVNGSDFVEEFSLQQFIGKKKCSVFLLSDGFYLCLPN